LLFLIVYEEPCVVVVFVLLVIIVAVVMIRRVYPVYVVWLRQQLEPNQHVHEGRDPFNPIGEVPNTTTAQCAYGWDTHLRGFGIVLPNFIKQILH
jgi:hypothetical protein